MTEYSDAIPVPPPAARAVFGEHLDEVVRYAVMLADAGVERGLIGPREVPRLWERHLLNCAVVTDLVPSGASVVDIGSGAGLPGIVMALRRPDLEVALVEPLLRRTRFLNECVEQLGLEERVTVVRGRAEEVAGDVSGDVVTARAVAPLAKLAGWALPLVATPGSLLAMKGRAAATEFDAARATLKRLGGSAPQILEVGGEALDEPTIVVRVDLARPTRMQRKR